MNLLFLYGKPAVGKLTVARELAALTGYRLFHNHLTVDLLLSVFDFGSSPFVELREEIWLSVFDRAGRAKLPGLIFTFAPETTVQPEFIARTLSTAKAGGGDVRFIELTCPMDEIYRRIDSQSRRQTGKLTSHEEYERLEAAGVFATSHMPKAAVTVDTGRTAPAAAAVQIVTALGLKPPAKRRR
jgi:hypothetical protein